MKSHSALENAMNQSSDRLLGPVPESFEKFMALIVFSFIEEHDRFVKATIIHGIIIISHSRESIGNAKGIVGRFSCVLVRLSRRSLGVWKWWRRKRGRNIMRETTREWWKRNSLQNRSRWKRHWRLVASEQEHMRPYSQPHISIFWAIPHRIGGFVRRYLYRMGPIFFTSRRSSFCTGPPLLSTNYTSLVDADVAGEPNSQWVSSHWSGRSSSFLIDLSSAWKLLTAEREIPFPAISIGSTVIPQGTHPLILLLGLKQTTPAEPLLQCQNKKTRKWLAVRLGVL